MKRALLVLILVGCGGDPAGPASPFGVAFSQVVNSKGFNAQMQREECDFTVTAVASGGEEGELALWGSYDVEFRYPDGTSDAFVFTQTDAVDFWGSDRIITGNSQPVNWLGWHPTKTFTLFYTFRYVLMTDEQRSESLSINCL